MKILFVVNEADALRPGKTTTALVRTQATRGPTWIVATTDLTLDDTGPHALAREVSLTAEGFTIGGREALSLAHFDRILIRTNPATQTEPWAWQHALTVLERATELGVVVHNQPRALRRLASKPGLLLLPESVRPPTTVTGNAREIRKAIARHGRSVVKPAHGSHGIGVFIVEPDGPNLGATLDILLERGPVVVQPWLPEAVDGDVRLFVVDGEPLMIKGVAAAVRRRPARGELRSNVHLGGRPEVAPYSSQLRRIAECVGPVLADLGVRFAGLDCIGDRIVEVNVCAPGGLTDMNTMYGEDFVSAWLDRLTDTA